MYVLAYAGVEMAIQQHEAVLGPLDDGVVRVTLSHMRI